MILISEKKHLFVDTIDGDYIGQPWQYIGIISVYINLPNPWRITARPWRRHTACACLSLAAILSTSSAHPLLLSASVAPSPSSCRRSSSSLVCCWTALKASCLRICPTRAARSASLDRWGRRRPGCRSATKSLPSASRWTRWWTSSLASPHAPKHQPRTHTYFT